MNMTFVLFGAIAVLLILFILLTLYVYNLATSLHQAGLEIKKLKQFTSLQQKQLKSLSHELQSMTNAAYGVGKRINQLAGHIRELDDRQEEFDLKDQGSHSMQQAIALVHKGASIEDLVESCELSAGEAELLIMVHGQQN
jgi:cell division protein FtsL